MNLSEWILIESSGEVEAQPPEFSKELNGKPEAYRHVLRRRRNAQIQTRRLTASSAISR